MTKKDILQPFRKLIDWWHKRHMAYRDVLAYDLQGHRYILNRNTIEQNQVTPTDLMIDGEKWKVFKTFLTLPTVPDTRTETDENGEETVYLNPTPISWNLYNESDTLYQARTGEFRPKIINPLFLALIIGIGALLLLFMFMM